MMLLLDSNVISALMSPQPDLRVLMWLDRQSARSLFLPSVVIAEIRYGLQQMPVGARRAALLQQFTVLESDVFEGRVLPFGKREAEAYGVLRADRESAGRPMSIGDAQIAATARVHDAVVVTRNTKDFEDCGLRLVNPFD